MLLQNTTRVMIANFLLQVDPKFGKTKRFYFIESVSYKIFNNLLLLSKPLKLMNRIFYHFMEQRSLKCFVQIKKQVCWWFVLIKLLEKDREKAKHSG